MRILIATDGSYFSNLAVDEAVALLPVARVLSSPMQQWGGTLLVAGHHVDGTPVAGATTQAVSQGR